MRLIIAFAAIVLAAAWSRPAAAFQPTRYPLVPRLVLNEMPAVCGSFHAAVVEAFHGDSFSIDIRNRDWPGASPEWVFTFKQSQVARLPNATTRQIDLDGDGREEVLAIGASTLQTLDTYTVLRFPSLEAYTSAAAQPDGLSSLLRRRDASERLSLGSGWSPWAFPSIASIGGVTVLIAPDADAIDTPVQTLYRVGAEGPLTKLCEVSLWPEQPSLGSMSQGPVGDFIRLLENIAGPAGGCGTSPGPGIHMRFAKMTQPRLAWRPWSLNDQRPRPERYGQSSPTDRRTIDRFLASWGYSSLWNYREYRRLSTAEGAATAALAEYYRDVFGVSETEGLAEANRALDQVIRRQFVAPEYGPLAELRSGVTAELERAALRHAPATEIEALIAAGARLEGQAPPEYSYRMREPPLFFTLEHRDVVRQLLDAGADVNGKNAFDKTALMYAAQFDLIDAANLLLDRGADVAARTKHLYSCDLSLQINMGDRTALMYAAESASLAMIQLLLERGANARATDTSKRDVLSYLSRNKGLSAADRGAAEEAIRRAARP